MARVTIPAEVLVRCPRTICAAEYTTRTENPVSCPRCLVPSTVISGDFKSVSDYSVGDRVVSSDRSRGTVLATGNRRHDGDVVVIKASGCLPLRLTAEHPVLRVSVLRRKNTTVPQRGVRTFARPEFVPAEKITVRPAPLGTEGRGDYLVVPREKGDDSTTHLDLTPFTNASGAKIMRSKGKATRLPLTPDIAWILGLWAAEGTSSAKEAAFHLGAHEANLIDELRSKLTTAGLRSRCTTRGPCIIVSVDSRVLSRALASWCGRGAKSKRFPSFIIHHERDDLVVAFLSGLLRGDGTVVPVNGRHQYMLATISPILALQTQFACARLGGFAGIHRYEAAKHPTVLPDGRVIRGNGGYQVWIRDAAIMRLLGHPTSAPPVTRPQYHVFPEHVLVPVRSVTREEYHGDVLNLETSTGDYSANNLVVHNCKYVFNYASGDPTRYPQRIT